MLSPLKKLGNATVYLFSMVASDFVSMITITISWSPRSPVMDLVRREYHIRGQRASKMRLYGSVASLLE